MGVATKYSVPVFPNVLSAFQPELLSDIPAMFYIISV
jgi:hypothetical protein